MQKRCQIPVHMGTLHFFAGLCECLEFFAVFLFVLTAKGARHGYRGKQFLFRAVSCEFVDRVDIDGRDDPRNHTKHHQTRPLFRGVLSSEPTTNGFEALMAAP